MFRIFFNSEFKVGIESEEQERHILNAFRKVSSRKIQVLLEKKLLEELLKFDLDDLDKGAFIDFLNKGKREDYNKVSLCSAGADGSIQYAQKEKILKIFKKVPQWKIMSLFEKCFLDDLLKFNLEIIDRRKFVEFLKAEDKKAYKFKGNASRHDGPIELNG